MEAPTRASPATVKAILDSALDSIVVMDKQGVIVEFNQAAERMFGWTREEALGSTVADVMVPPHMREAHWNGLARYQETGEGPVIGRRVELEGMRRDGTLFPVELAIVPFQADGQHLFAGYLRDLSAQREAEERVAYANAVAVLLRDIPLQASRAGTFEQAARMALRLLCRFAGWPVGHVFVREGDVLVSSGIWHFEGGGRFDGFRQVTEATRLGRGEGLPGRAWQNHQPEWSEDVRSDPGFPRARHARDLEVSCGLAFPVRLAGRTEAVLEFYGESPAPPDETLLDICYAIALELGRALERIRTREELSQANAQLAEMARRRADFLNIAAHELKTPLTPLLMQSQMLRRAGPLNAAQQQCLAVVERNTERLRKIVDDMLEAARAQSRTLSVELQETELATVAKEVVETYGRMARDKGIRFRLQCEAGRADADPQRIAQVMDNLVSNAIKFTPPGGRVTMRCGTRQGEAFIEVEDTGPGVPAGERHRLFQPFSQVHPDSQELGGTGLGLYVCRAIVEAHGGSIGMDSENGGSRFWVRWPAHATPEAD